MQAFETKYNICNSSLFGGLKDNLEAASQIEHLWDDWLDRAEIEIRSNFGMETPGKPGAPFDIKQGSLQQALASREHMCMKNIKATRWALRRCQEVCSHHGKAQLPYPTLYATRDKWKRKWVEWVSTRSCYVLTA